ncbi:MAG TPA: hypothetical protein VK524_28540 [Polyangiaceae bacterium]|nr:hypothetical protein [Polyangiaceae bacterium]
MRSLRRALHDALCTVLFASPAVPIGCGGSTGIEDDPDFVPIACEDGTQQWLRDVQPAEFVDFMELRTLASGAVSEWATLASEGSKCEGASDPTACQATYDAVAPETGFRFSGCGLDWQCTTQLGTTQGDSVTFLTSADELRAFLAPIGSAQEALLLVAAQGLDIPCGRGGTLPAAGSYLVQAFARVGCDGRDRHLMRVAADGTVSRVRKTTEKKADPNCQVGRRPAGLEPACGETDTVGGYLAAAASLEAASVFAFLQLRAELAGLGAPRHLQRAAERAARDEVRHARVVAALARAFGASVVKRRIHESPPRDLEALACENAAEGCVRETFGALQGHFQAQRARHAAVRRTYGRIALDETRHAELAWQVAAWSSAQLPERARRRVAEARRSAIEVLRGELAQEPADDVRRLAGVPSAAEARTMFARLRQTLWA